ncbi:Lrp/AsnC family transcriptional regulator [Lampropedia aestuarii]|uniref:Lrp/AsnC family transcriptional regulator n=1 Tax=Lampropedia aestuarii TaxID=2562762 RepID=A0A4S5BMY6_9BURK|nr:Lrp/AsnC family transcriptional regulator [Lampropedia aestuarii]MDH5857174.1 Lrp/AsnC family transcriptional regulator [Lampropedia aestuarii]THJ32221.1 Lrp/AsnC family transcriptional regulator [Lampropedia aestuarii]
MNEKLDSIDRKLLALVQQDASISNQALAALVHVSPATCLRRMQRLRESGVLERQVALVNPWALAEATGQPPALTCFIEVSLDRQDAEAMQAFEDAVLQFEQVQQCWRVASGPDFVMVVQVLTMEHYQQLVQALLKQSNAVRNVKAYFATKRVKYNTQVVLPAQA